jgi:hypothetical protein
VIVLPRYRSLLPPAPNNANPAQFGNNYVDQETVHGGESDVRPNMQESMVFLRKLFTHQQQQEGSHPFPNLLSPPDDPMRKFLTFL